MADKNKTILSLYVDAISQLKVYELHSSLKKEGKTMLIHAYYDEPSMNKWRDSCTRN
jgi:hypothetical protein